MKIRHPDTKLHVYDRIKGTVNTFDLSKYKRYPVKIGWDSNDSRMLACEAVRIRTNSNTNQTVATASKIFIS